MSSDSVFPVLSFRLGQQDYALLIEDVVEVASMVEVMTMAGVSAEVLGLVNRHGSVLPLLDLRAIFQQSSRPFDIATLFIVAQIQGRQAGLVIDEIYQVEHIGMEQLQNIAMRGKYIQNVVRRGDHLMQVVALSPLFADFYPENQLGQ
jgi:purine-binding chemotaxis protein CheW